MGKRNFILGLVLLLVAIYLWVRSNSQIRTLRTAPFLVIFCTLYLLVQYVFNLNYAPGEFVAETRTIDFGSFSLTISLEDIRLTKESMPDIAYLGVQCVFLCVFWESLRSFVLYFKRQRENDRIRRGETVIHSANSTGDDLPLEPITEDQRNGGNQDELSTEAIMKRVKEVFSAVWMTICVAVLLFVSTHGFPTAINIVYMIFFLVFANYTVFRVASGTSNLPDFENFFRVVLLFTMAALCVIYVYQFSFFFDQFDFFKDNSDILAQFGLTSNASDTWGIVYPTAVLLIVIKIHFDFFGDSFQSFMRHFATDVSGIEETSSFEAEIQRIENEETGNASQQNSNKELKKRQKIRSAFRYVRERIWIMLVVHTEKILLILLFVAIKQEVSAVNVAFLLLYVLMCVAPKFLGNTLKNILFILACGFVVVRMAYQNELINENIDYSASCSNQSINDSNFIYSNIYEWVGLYVYDAKNSDTKVNSFTYLWFYLLIILCVLVESLMLCRVNAKEVILQKRSQNSDRQFAQKARESLDSLRKMKKYRIIFPEAVRRTADSKFLTMIGFLINFWFYKFGFEITVLTILLNCGTHADFYSTIYLIVLFAMVLSPRKTLLTKTYVMAFITSIFLIVKFCFLLWLPPLEIFCDFDELNWLEHPQNTIDKMSLKRFFFIPDFSDPQTYSIGANRLVGDFFQLLILRSFLINLKDERPGLEELNKTRHRNFGSISSSSNDEVQPLHEIGGSNEGVLESEGAQGENSSEPGNKSNFLTNEKDSLSIFKKIIFNHGFWVTYAIVCLTGMQDVDIFGFIFFGFGFYLLWLGQDIALYPRKKAIYYMNCILVYAIITCLLRVLLQLVPFYCYTTVFNDNDKLMKFLNLFDITLLNKYEDIAIALRSEDQTCSYARVKSDIFGLEAACIVFLLLQRRIFNSQYYTQVMNEAQKASKMAIEGGKLINQMIEDEKAARKSLRDRLREELTNSVEQIKKRFEGEEWREPRNHVEAIFTGERFFAKTAEDGSSLGALTASEELSSFLTEPKTPEDELIIQRWQPFTDYITKTVKVEKKPKKSKEELEPSEAKSEENQSSDDQIPEDAPETNDVAASDQQSQPDSEFNGFLIVSNVTYYLLITITTVIRELGIAMDRASSNFRAVNEKLRERGEELRNADTETNNGSDNGEVPEITVTTQDVAIEITEDNDDGDDNGSEVPGHLADVPGASSQDNLSDTLRTDDINNRRTVSLMDLVGTDDQRLPSPGEYISLLLKKFWLSFYYFLVAQTDYFCYFMITLSLMLNGSIADAVLAMITLVWALLSRPRPSKTFWSFCITYVVALILLKYCLKFRIFDYNLEDHSIPAGLQLCFGINDEDSLFITQLLLLISLCFHRNILVSFGLWIAPKKPVVAETSDHESDNSDPAEKRALIEKHSGQSNGSNQNENGQGTSESNTSDQLLLPSSVENDEQLIPANLSDEENSKRSWGQFFKDLGSELVLFVNDLRTSENTAVKDVYATMFFFDAMGYLVIIFGYHGFSVTSGDTVQSGGTIVSLVSENQVPILLLAYVLILFFYQLADRLAYLTKNVKLKIGIFVSQIILVHFWLIIINRSVTNEYFYNNRPAQIFYFFRWVYWLLSAYQIKCSYPVRVLGNFFSKRYNIFYKVCMIAFVSCPFAFEIRVLMDWIFTETTLTFNRWLEVEDVFVSTFIVNCTRISQKNDNRKRGQKEPIFPSKIIYFSFLVVLLVVIWGPILLFSYLNATKVSTEITYTDFKLQIGTYLPIFEASQLKVNTLTYDQFSAALSKELNNEMLNLNFFDPDSSDFSKVTYSSESENLWTITPPAKQNLIADLNSTNEVLFYVEYTFSRISLSSSASNFPATSTGSTTIELDENAKNGLVNILTAQNSTNSQHVDIKAVIPTLYYIQDTGTVSNTTISDDKSTEWYTIRLQLNSSSEEEYSGLKWWVLSTTRKANPTNRNFADQFSIYIVMDKVVPDMYSSLASYGILGLYSAFVLLVATWVKGMFTGFAAKIMWEEIPDVSLLQTLTKEIYLCRETQNLTLEEDLYAQLQYLYRSPDVMIKNTKLKLD